MKLLKLKLQYIPFILLFLFIKWGYGCMLEGILVLKKLVYQKSLSYSPPTIYCNKLCPGFLSGLSQKFKFSFTSNHNVVVWPQIYRKDSFWPN